MKKLCTWKLLKTTRRFWIRNPFVRHTPLTYRTRNFPPLRLLCPKTRNPGNNSRMLPPFTGITSYRVRTRLALHVVMLCITMHMLALYLLVLPPLLSLDTETDAAATQYDYGVDDPSLLPEQPDKSPLLITRYRLLFYILLALE